jgi:hypothetical protein
MTDTETKKCHNSITNRVLIEVGNANLFVYATHKPNELEKMKIISLEKQEAILELKLTVAMKELMKIMKEMN